MKPNAKLFKCSLYNAQSLNTCGEDMILAVQAFMPDIVAINESWLREGRERLAPIVPGYKFKMLPRPLSICRGHGGGVAFYIREGFSARTIRHVHHSDVEQWWLRTNVNGLKVVMGTAYRSQRVSVDIFLDALTETITSFANFDKIVLLGDFNIDQRKSNTDNYKKFQSFLQYTNLNQYVNESTHFTDETATIIDLACTDAPVKSVNVVSVAGVRGHCMVNVVLNIKKSKYQSKYITYRPIKDINLDNFNKNLLECYFNHIINLNNINQMTDSLNRVVLNLFDIHAPLKTIYAKKINIPWITSGVRFMAKLRDDALSRYRSSNLNSHKEYYKALKKQVEITMVNEKRAFYNQRINAFSSDSKTF